MKRLLPAMIIVIAFFLASCSSMDQKKGGISGEGPAISPSPAGTASESIPYQ